MEIFSVNLLDGGKFEVVTALNPNFSILLDNEANAYTICNEMTNAFLMGMGYSRSMIDMSIQKVRQEILPTTSATHAPIEELADEVVTEVEQGS